MRRSGGLKQQLSWKATTATAATAVAAATVAVENHLIGTTVLPTSGPLEEGTIRRVLLYVSVLGGAANAMVHMGLMVQQNEAGNIDPRTGADDERWMWWFANRIDLGVLWQPADFNGRPFDIRVNRKFTNRDVLRFYIVSTSNLSFAVHTRVLFGTGLRRAS